MRDNISFKPGAKHDTNHIVDAHACPATAPRGGHSGFGSLSCLTARGPCCPRRTLRAQSTPGESVDGADLRSLYTFKFALI